MIIYAFVAIFFWASTAYVAFHFGKAIGTVEGAGIAAGMIQDQLRRRSAAESDPV